MPAISSLFLDMEEAAREAGVSSWDLGAEFWNQPQPTQAEISRVGELPYVRTYDVVMMPSMFSRELEWAVLELDEERLSPFNASHFESEISGFGRSFGGDMENFQGRGVTNPELTDMENGLIELVVGRTFTQSEIDSGATVAVISNLFAQTNNLNVGDIFVMENIAHNIGAMALAGYGNFTVHWGDERFYAAQRDITFEVIGIFDVAREFLYENHTTSHELSMALRGEGSLHNRIYMPISLAEDMLAFVNEAFRSIEDELYEAFGSQIDDMIREEPRIQAVFVLYDPRDLERFNVTATGLLPGDWSLLDLRGVDGSVTASMDTMQNIADLILWVTVGATVIILSLLITLFLKDRRHEIGIYLAVGERKWKVLTQLLLEVLTVSLVAIVLALFAGNGISGGLSRHLLEQNLMAEQGNPAMTVTDSDLELLSPGELSVDDLMALYDTSLDIRTMTLFLGVSGALIVVSTVIPMSYVLKLKPKKILM